MNQYQVHVKIKDRPQAHYEFKWMGESCRSGVEEIDVVIEAEDEADAALVIFKTSENTLDVVNVFLHQTQNSEQQENTIQEQDKYAADYAQMCIPIPPKKILDTVFVAVSKN